MADASIGGTNAKNGAKVLTITTNSGGSSGSEAATIVSAVSGEAVLASIVESGESDAAVGGGNAGANTSAISFAKGGSTANNLAQDAVLASAVAGGIALRSLVKDGKLASHSGNDNKAVQSAGITAVNKLLGAIEEVIKKTVKNVIEKAKGKIDKARDSKGSVS